MKRLVLSIAFLGLFGAGLPLLGAEITWKHPGGMIDEATLLEIRSKIDNRDWAKKVYESQKRILKNWLDVSSERFSEVFPKKRGNVYHNFSCPDDRATLTFDPFHPEQFDCPVCKRKYPPETDAGIYNANDRYHGTMLDGWICRFFQAAGDAARDLAVIGALDNSQAHRRRGIEILMLFAKSIDQIPTTFERDRHELSVLLTYSREGDNKILFDLACAYELLRDHMTPDERTRFEKSVLTRMMDDIMLEPIYTYNHNNLYQWYRTIIQTAVALERDDWIDWSFGYGQYAPEMKPDHNSLRQLIARHFKPDGAYWEMCSGYHLYPVFFFCELAVLSRHLSPMDPERFPANRYDLTDSGNPGEQVIRNALHWFMSMAMPDRTMPTVGDSMAARAGMNDYYMAAEVGYRYFKLKSVGDYDQFQKGNRSWFSLLYGAPEIEKHDLPFASSYLSSGWVSLRGEWRGNRVWAGLNSLIPGGGHQHADRLAFLWYSHGTLLALEKATPYNEMTLRQLGTQTPMHNTVTVDKESQKHGSTLRGEEIPQVAFFFNAPVARFSEVHGDHVYPQTSIYRRSVAVIEDVAVDRFDARGGKTHDWMLHHAGTSPGLSLAMTQSDFDPKQWLYSGTANIRRSEANDQWDAQWKVNDVTSRLTMLGAAGTEVFSLETYPVEGAVVTPGHPACQTLCVRRRGDAPFLAVWDAWKEQPNLRSVEAGSDRGASVKIQTASHVYYVLFGKGKAVFSDGVELESDGAFAALRDRDAAMLVGGKRLRAVCAEGDLELIAEEPISVCAEKAVATGKESPERVLKSGPIQYDTHGGEDHPRPVPGAAVTIQGSLWKR